MPSPFDGAKKSSNITLKHRPLIWECMLGTVYARNADGKVKYFDYDYTAARKYAGVDNCQDLRLYRLKPKDVYQNYPTAKQLAMFGVHP